MPAYTTQWFQSFQAASNQSANVIVPILLELTCARSVVDVGCGLGSWLQAFQSAGVDDVFGVDGTYVDTSQLRIAGDRFAARDLSQPLSLTRNFELCICLEVAEHLPATSADTLVQSLTQLAPIVCFSAAIPSQGGTHHVNEQWPAYWIEKFRQHDYTPVDAIRQRIWNDPRVDYWYCQNLLLFANAEALADNTVLQSSIVPQGADPLPLVHPQLWARTAAALDNTVDVRCRRVLRRAYHLAKRVVGRA
ncbi:MAG: class I SAM-dependent methyltransferase [Planctomycetales bacterium]|nr:class I SAM-dependent methyltransferase [Planctomycetales bacterium]